MTAAAAANLGLRPRCRHTGLKVILDAPQAAVADLASLLQTGGVDLALGEGDEVEVVPPLFRAAPLLCIYCLKDYDVAAGAGSSACGSAPVLGRGAAVDSCACGEAPAADRVEQPCETPRQIRQAGVGA